LESDGLSGQSDRGISGEFTTGRRRDRISSKVG